MKKIVLLICCLMLTLLIGCSSSNPKLLVGKWEDTVGSKTEFKSDGNFIHRVHSGNDESSNKLIEGTYRAEKGMLEMQYSLDGKPVTLSQKYKINKDVLELTVEDGGSTSIYKKVQ